MLAENEALRRQVRHLEMQLAALLDGEPEPESHWRSGGSEPQPTAAAGSSQRSRGREPWDQSARARSRRPENMAGGEASQGRRSRVTVGSSHGISPDLLDRWVEAMASHPRWPALRLGPPGGLRGLEQELRRHWWNPALSLAQELDRRSPGLGSELAEALRGPHSRGRWAVRAAFALYGPRALEWLGEDPRRVVEELCRRLEELDRRTERGTRTQNHSHQARPQADESAAGGAQQATGQGHGGGSGQRRSHQGGSQNRSTKERGTQGRRSGPGQTATARAAADQRHQALALLGLEPGASAAAIKRAYRRLAKTHHPDLGGDPEAFLRLDAAYRALL